MSRLFYLAARAYSTDRPFTEPAHTATDQLVLADALTSLRRLLSVETLPTSPIEWQEGGRYRRLILGDTTLLRTLPALVFVGFFGQRRPNADMTPILQIDGAMLAELSLHPGVLCYYTIELADGNYGNLVLFCNEEAKCHWGASALHAQAVQTLAPGYYATVRIHNGVVPGGLGGGEAPVIERTRYYDYTDPLIWRAVREF